MQLPLKHIQSNWPYSFLFFATLLTFLFYLTSNSYGYQFAIENGFADVGSYINIASSKDLESLYILSAKFPWQHLERWVPHTLIGEISRIFKINLWSTYKAFNLLCICLSIILINSLKCSHLNRMAYFSLLILNPYTFRYFAGAPGMISDSIFFVSLIAFCVALFNKNFFLLYLAIIFACISRQTGALLLPILFLTYFYDKSMLKVVVIGIFIGFICLLVTKLSSLYIFKPVEQGYLLDVTLGIFFWIAHKFNMNELVNFLGRYILMLFSISPILILVKNQKIDRLAIFGILFFIIMQSQPILGGPYITGSNIDRLAILGLPFLGMIILRVEINIKSLLIFTSLLAFTSLNPYFSVLYETSPYNRYLFVTIIVTVFCVSIYSWFKKRPLAIFS